MGDIAHWKAFDLIKSNPTYRQTIFPAGASRLVKWLVARDVCIELFEDEMWILDAERRGIVKENAEGGWEPTGVRTSSVQNPIIAHLSQRV